MKIIAAEVNELFNMLSEKVGQPLDRSGLFRIADAIHGTVNQRFLDDKLREAKKLKGNQLMSIRDSKLEELVEYLGFKDYASFKKYLKQPIPQELVSCEGEWINFVRQNSNSGIIFASPVRISQNGQEMKYELFGPSYKYSGKIVFKNGLLFTLFSTEMGKEFHHVYKIGNRISPEVLQGAFSGTSTSNEPIAGRTLLVKKDYLTNPIAAGAYKIKELQNADDEFKQALASYFSRYEDNNIKINRVLTFGIEDLL